MTKHAINHVYSNQNNYVWHVGFQPAQDMTVLLNVSRRGDVSASVYEAKNAPIFLAWNGYTWFHTYIGQQVEAEDAGKNYIDIVEKAVETILSGGDSMRAGILHAAMNKDKVAVSAAA